MTLITRLDNLGDAVFTKFPYINHGGCCVYAAVVAECLLEYGIKAKGIVAATRAKTWSGGRKALGHTRKKVEKNTTFEWNYYGVTFAHVGLEFRHKGEVWHYDTKGCHPKSKTLDDMPIYRGKLSLDEMKQLTTGDQGWNTTFNKRHIPAVRKMVRDALCKPKTV